jgi:phosphoribosylanthranilate isomerase
MTRVKLCGFTDAADLSAGIDAGADAVGIIADVTVDTPREVTVDRARRLVDQVPPFVTSVLVTMPGSPEEAGDLVDSIDPDAVQVHGQSPDDLRVLRAALDRPLLAAVDVTADVAAHAEHVDAVLLDSTDEQGGGGTGETHDWARSHELVAELDTPVVLAGGLTPDNVAEAVERVDPFAVDVASGVERSPGERDARRGTERSDGVERAGGVKDHDAMRRFVACATGRGEVA